jgi:3-oxoacyl-[acyl-carrier protein] reductase
MSPSLTSQVAIVTGSSKGIGASVATHLAAAGAAVVVNYASSQPAAERVVAQIAAAGGRAIAVQGDVSKPANIRRLFAETQRAYGRLDILINNAGTYAGAALEAITPEHFHHHFDVNVLGVLLASQEALKYFGPEGGVILNMSSVVSTMSPPQRAVYAATKAALDSNVDHRRDTVRGWRTAVAKAR